MRFSARMEVVRAEFRLRALIMLASGMFAGTSLLIGSTITCAPLVLPDGQTILGPCEDDSWFPQPPWWYLPLTPPAPEPPPLPPFAYFLDPGAPLPPSEFFLLAFEPGWTLPDFATEPPAFALWTDPPIFTEPAPEHAPEPGGLALIGLGLLVLGILGRWRAARPRD